MLATGLLLEVEHSGPIEMDTPSHPVVALS